MRSISHSRDCGKGEIELIVDIIHGVIDSQVIIVLVFNMLKEACKYHNIDTNLDQDINKLSLVLIIDILRESLEQEQAPLIHHNEELEGLIFSSH